MAGRKHDLRELQFQLSRYCQEFIEEAYKAGMREGYTDVIKHVQLVISVLKREVSN